MTDKTLKPCPELLEKLEQLQQDLERETTYKDFWQEQAETVGKRYAELVKKCKEELENKPLTLDQIKELVGEPVYATYSQLESMNGWRVIKFRADCKGSTDTYLEFTDGTATYLDEIAQGEVKLYRSKPEPNQVTSE